MQQPSSAAAPQPKPRRRWKRKEQPSINKISRTEKSLSCLIQALESRKLVIELRNDVIIRGTLEEADEYMK